MPTPTDSLRRATRERDAAVKRGDDEAVRMLDQAIAQLMEMIDENAPHADADPPADVVRT